jgi:hypothetical protein
MKGRANQRCHLGGRMVADEPLTRRFVVSEGELNTLLRESVE